MPKAVIIVIAVALAVAAFVIPSSVGYQSRDRVTEGVTVMSACRTEVAHFAQARKAWPADAREAGCAAVGGKFHSAPRTRHGRVEITLLGIHDDVNNRVLMFEPYADAAETVRADPAKPIEAWRCSAGGGPRMFKHLPANCRQASPALPPG